MYLRTTIPILLIGLASCTPSPGPMERVETYQTLSNRYDVDGLMAMFADDARLDFGPLGIIQGEELIRGIHEYDRAIGTELAFEDCVLSYRTVTCRAVERNEWLSTAGIDSIEYARSEFEFDAEGQIARVAAELTPASGEAMGRALGAFDAWARSNREDEYLKLFRDDRSFIYSYESGERVLGLLRDWRAAEPGA